MWAIKSVQKIEIFIPLKSYVDFSVIYYIKTSVVALFSVKPMFSVNLMSVKVMYHCIRFGESDTKYQDRISFTLCVAEAFWSSFLEPHGSSMNHGWGKKAREKDRYLGLGAFPRRSRQCQLCVSFSLPHSVNPGQILLVYGNSVM